MQQMKWHPDPLVNRDINVKRTALSLQYMTKINEWLEKPDTAKQEEVRNCKRVIEGKNGKLSLNMLERIDSYLKKLFSPIARPINTIDLTEENDEDVQEVALPNAQDPEQNVQPNAAILVETPSALLTLPGDALPRINSLFSDGEISEAYKTSETSNKECLASSNNPPLRRKSVSSKPPPLVANQPLISTYKIKHNTLKPPCIYARPIELENNKPRQIITVPYKTAPKQSTQIPYNPKDESTRLEGIKQKIYADKFLSFDAKEDLKKKFIAQQAVSDEKSDSNDVNPPQKSRRKSTAVAHEDISSVHTKNVESSETESEAEKLIPVKKRNEPSKKVKPKAKSKSKSTIKRDGQVQGAKIPIKPACSTKQKSNFHPRISTFAKKSTSRQGVNVDSESEEDNEVPSHVFQVDKNDFSEFFNEKNYSRISSFNPEPIVNDNSNSSTSNDDPVTESGEIAGEHEMSTSLLVEISESEAYHPPKKRGRKPGNINKKRRNAVDEVDPLMLLTLKPDIKVEPENVSEND